MSGCRHAREGSGYIPHLFRALRQYKKDTMRDSWEPYYGNARFRQPGPWKRLTHPGYAMGWVTYRFAGAVPGAANDRAGAARIWP
jgi:hypothetical protein